MSKYKIIALFGPAGSGKDYLKNGLVNHEDLQGKVNKIISYTSRPPREGELDGVDYNFITPDEFQKKVDSKEMLEYTDFRLWWYGTAIDSLKEDKINIGVFNPIGARNLLLNPNLLVKPFYVKASDRIRLLRQLNREEEPDCDEIVRRFVADRRDFMKYEIPFNYGELRNETEQDGYWAIRGLVSKINMGWPK